ncbi:MAG: hypothetical protein COU10_02675 [Candidatus Harrisonbacteria bacterium CG10_big_fil_rev_8_21_14_0_10_45_28]|uniref:50S ribosomal protein L35 n=1 Tax=Candidatus Harrisonbacteria bacterium CG10_big_fil_rev_8_21_14_0_10_45_28 TaxID=1974586 RepID=A0A2H0UN04_9BACT|nr:MAG: hypothetical protein COU10_02675 [Candidatus Harrisonbacteria bacterium CG10_big_fil_rev_8_21_14_0_10_45_28]
MKKTVTKRIKIGKSGKMTRRKMRIGHNGTRDSKTQKDSHRKTPTVFKADAKLIRVALNRVN